MSIGVFSQGWMKIMSAKYSFLVLVVVTVLLVLSSVFSVDKDSGSSLLDEINAARQ